VEIYAELFFNDKKNEFIKSLPAEIIVKRKGNSRACIFECEDEAKESLIEILERHQVCYQEADV